MRGQYFWFGLIGLFFALVLMSIFGPSLASIFDSVGVNLFPDMVKVAIGSSIAILFFLVIIAFVLLISRGRVA